MIKLEPPRGVPEGAKGWRALGLHRARLMRFATRAREAMDLSGEVDILLSSDAVIRRLNREYRGKNKSTDVLSFPAPPEIVEAHAGDLAVSLETAARQAHEHGHSLEEEVRVLLLHGFLHLNGMDHETDAGEMAACEAELRKKLKLPQSLIARTANPVRMPDTAPARVQKSESSAVKPSGKRKAT